MDHPIAIHPPRNEIFRAFRAQSKVVGALILREVRTRFGKDRLGYLTAFIEPCVHIAVWYVIVWFIKQRHEMDGMSSLLFLASGIIPLFFFQRVANYLKGSISANRALLRYPLVKNLDLMLARFVLEACTMIAVAILLWGTLILFGSASFPDNLLGIFYVSPALFLLGFGFGAFNAVMTIISSGYTVVLGFISRALYMSSGAFFAIDRLPPQALKFFEWNPLCHGISLFRAGCFSTFHSTFASLWYIYAVGFVFLAVALASERVFREELHQEE